MGLASKGSGPLAEAIDRVLATRMTDLSIEIGHSVDPERCRADLLPWLAYTRGVDVWSGSWSEAQKRAVVRDAYKNFKRRGTRTGLELELGNLLSDVTIFEWWEEAAAAATFRVNVEGTALESLEAQDAISEVVVRNAPYTRHSAVTVENRIGITGIAAVGVRIGNMINVDSKIPALRP